jgi:hypothetical protein
MGEMINYYNTLGGELQDTFWKTLSVDERIILRWILMKYDVRLHTRFTWFRIGFSEHLDFINGEFLDKLREY